MKPFALTIIRAHAPRTCRAGAAVGDDTGWFAGLDPNPYEC